MCFSVFDKNCCPKFKWQKGKEKFLEKTQLSQGISFLLKAKHCDVRANEAGVIDINILQGKEHSECHIIREYGSDPLFKMQKKLFHLNVS